MKNIRSRQPCISMNFWTESSSSMWVSLKGYNISTWEIITKGVIKKAPLKAVVKAKAVIESCYWKLLWKKKNILGTQWLQKSQWVTYRICGAKVNTKSLADFFFFFQYPNKTIRMQPQLNEFATRSAKRSSISPTFRINKLRA